MVQVSIHVDNISKTFDIKSKSFYGGISKVGTKKVLDSLSFDLFKGEVLGLIGKNGSGKSTLLKILANIMRPDAGDIKINGRIASILELSMGFNNENSGRENIRMKCSLYGMDNKEIDACIEDIIIFSEIGDQIDDPLRTYSSGMVAKLAFSVLIHVKCEILIIDEVLSVGDASFNMKSRLAFEKMKKNGQSIILASHNLSTLETMCDRVLWIDNGSVREIGDPVNVCYHYSSDSIDSINTVLKLANAGDVLSMNRVGIMYRDGIDTEKNLDESMKWFKKASDLGHSEAQYNLANLFKKDGNIEQYNEYLTKAANTGYIPAIISLSNQDLDANYIDELKQDIVNESNNGNSQVMKLLADMLFEGIVFEKDPEQAIFWLKKCSEFDNSRAEYTLGIAYRDGIGVQKDTAEAIKWFSLSSEHGYPKSRLEIANIYRKGIGIERNIDLAIQWYNTAALAGDSTAMLQLGLMYRDGLGIDADPKKAEYWLKMFSLQGLLNHEVIFADLIKKKYSGQEQKRCVKYYDHAASYGNVGGLNNLAYLSRDGGIINPDPVKALELFSKSSEKMNNVGLYELGMHYLKGIGTSTDYTKAFNLIKKASEMGNNQATLQLFLMYRDGIGTPVDLKSANHVLLKLLDQGNNAAKLIAFNSF